MDTLSPDARTWAEIDFNALLHNFNIARRTGKKVMCVIKADAYGHRAVRCGRFLEHHGADAFAVACLRRRLTCARAASRSRSSFWVTRARNTQASLHRIP